MSLSWPWTGLLRDLVLTRDSEQQLCGYVAVLSGARRALDDWIPPDRFDAYRRLARRLGLVVEVDCVFEPFEDNTAVLGSRFMPTTQARAVRFDQAGTTKPGSGVHVVAATSPDRAQEAQASSWYSVAVGQRIIRKPLVDHLRFGRALGYPECCIQFFTVNSNFATLNTPAEIARASTRLHWEANCLTKHTPWMTSFHMPCSFDCRETRETTTAVVTDLRRLDAVYAKRIEQFARQRFLLVNEVVCYALVGAHQHADGRVSYGSAVYVGYGRGNDRYCRQLAEGDQLSIDEGTIRIWQGGRLRHSLETCCSEGIMDVPMVLAFE